MIYLSAAIALVAAYLLGSIPFGLIAGKVTKGIDIRNEGSRNLGATNAFRLLGPVPGVLVLLADGAKGAAAVFLARPHRIFAVAEVVLWVWDFAVFVSVHFDLAKTAAVFAAGPAACFANRTAAAGFDFADFAVVVAAEAPPIFSSPIPN